MTEIIRIEEGKEGKRGGKEEKENIKSCISMKPNTVLFQL